MEPNLDGAVILLTGGTGSFGQAFARRVLTRWPGATIRVFSRDEFKQSEMAKGFVDVGSSLRWFLGDVRSAHRLRRAVDGADYVVHAAAMKQVEACEYNPFEAVQTNVLGSQNVVDAAIDANVHRVVALSTDKAVNPVNLYGATKLCEEKIVVQGNAYAANSGTRLSCVRYGNVVGSRGSVVPLFLAQKAAGRLTVTDARMTRFWITLDEAVDLVLYALAVTEGGEIFIPKIPSTRVMDLAAAIAPEIAPEITGIRPGEKLHELLLTADESRHAVDLGDRYLILPEHPWWGTGGTWSSRPAVPDDFTYSSETNQDFLSVDEIRARLGV